MITREELEQMYWGQGMSQSEIANVVGVGQATVGIWMKKCEVDVRAISEAKLKGLQKPSEKELGWMYLGQKMSMSEIAKEIGVSRSSVYIWMKEYGIVSRTNMESKLIGTQKISKEELNRMYWEQGMTHHGIADAIGVHSATIEKWMREYNIETRTISEARYRERNGNWQGGISFEPYCEKFNNEFRESVRERDDYTCQLCGRDQLIGGRKLSVHHIHYDKSDCWPDVVALCVSCHTIVNGNRDYWEKYFEEQLIIRGLSNWSISQSLS